MVVICNMPFPDTNANDDTFDGKQLSDFQKWSIKAINEGDHVLVTAHTGSGKTLPAEYAIQYFTQNFKKKVIYASPIKALSNQKLYDLRRKFPTISFGILTGDVKDNPEADVLIMTTEILRNTLLNKKIRNNANISNANISSANISSSNISSANISNASCTPLLFEMDFETELAAVVFDEVHYINDPERGSVWEQSILLLPPQVQLIMLSATIDQPEHFAGWIETEKNLQATKLMLPNKKMYLASTYTRVVPLNHYMWLSVNEGTVKKAVKTPYEQKLSAVRHVPIPIMQADANNSFREDNYYKVNDIKNYLYKNNIYAKRQFVIEDLLSYLKTNEMLPAICFVFSRKQVEQVAKEISFSLFDNDSDNWSIGAVEKECMHILKSKLSNYKEYMDLPEYTTILKLLEKGIAIHHAGIIPVLREMVELLFEKGFVRLLVATETFAVGLNMPTKTVIFTGFNKYNGSTMRQMFPHEYTQMAGRAGRRGKDTVGHIFHCVNLFDLPTAVDYKNMLTGKPQKLTSKFKISFNMTLSMIETKQDILTFMSQSLLSNDIQKEIIIYNIDETIWSDMLKNKKEQLQLCRTPENVLIEYKSLFDKLPHMVNSVKKQARNLLKTMEIQHHFLLTDLLKLESYYAANTKYEEMQKDKLNTMTFIENNVTMLTFILQENGFIYKNNYVNPFDTSYCITDKGKIASFIQEVHPLAITDLYIKTNQFSTLSSAELAGLFSCFYPLNVSDDKKAHLPAVDGEFVNMFKDLSGFLDHYQNCETIAKISSGSQYEIYYDLLPFVIEWCNSADDELQCKIIIQTIKDTTGVFLGEFIKALLKVNAIAQEFERVCEATYNMALLEKIRSIPKMTLKYIATSQSLYL